ncbi:MAG: hypothetical protein AVDCRST_MAG66-1812, partial [uncultured Pseudonocardia sp.]
WPAPGTRCAPRTTGTPRSGTSRPATRSWSAAGRRRPWPARRRPARSPASATSRGRPRPCRRRRGT